MYTAIAQTQNINIEASSLLLNSVGQELPISMNKTSVLGHAKYIRVTQTGFPRSIFRGREYSISTAPGD